MAATGEPVGFRPWSAADFALNLAIWWGTMLPAVTLMILIFATVNHRKPARSALCAHRAVHDGLSDRPGGLFGIGATLADWGREQTTDLTGDADEPGMERRRRHPDDPILSYALPLAARSGHCGASSTGSTASAAAGCRWLFCLLPE